MTQAARQRYRKRTDALVTAVQLRLDTPGLVYQKWGAEQRCKAGDWLIDNDGDIYTVSDESFRATYREVAAGRYRKTASVWAVAAEVAGTLSTQEGQTSYAAGDYLVSNDVQGNDSYAVGKARFEMLYARMTPGDDA